MVRVKFISTINYIIYDELLDEFKQLGTKYENFLEVEKYDNHVEQIRDVTQEVNEIAIQPDFQIIEIGCGPGN